MEPIDITNMSVSELKALLQEFDFDQKSLKMIKNRIKRLTILEEMQRIMPNFEAIIQQETNQKKKLTIQEEMQRMMPNFEAIIQQETNQKKKLTIQEEMQRMMPNFEEIEEDYKQKIQNKNEELEELIKYQNRDLVNNYLEQQKENNGIIRFEGDYNRIMIKYHLDDMMKFYKGKFIRIYYRDNEGKTTIFVYPIKNRLIQNIVNAIFKGINLEEQHTGSEYELEFKMLKAYKIEILTAENVFNKNLLENEKKLDDIDKLIKEKRDKKILLDQLILNQIKRTKALTLTSQTKFLKLIYLDIKLEIIYSNTQNYQENHNVSYTLYKCQANTLIKNYKLSQFKFNQIYSYFLYLKLKTLNILDPFIYTLMKNLENKLEFMKLKEILVIRDSSKKKQFILVCTKNTISFTIQMQKQVTFG
ncbi:Hypothetical_protein [Hexamita inflata]|uniref:Hypothetical_protein n=1 Tax=Hexamita inflata TaxID=28002 RepID=A0AA86QQU6_9EUKA|nr:Hypothetical protein HINF_LOCUS46462 [Hexamita inflata]